MQFAKYLFAGEYRANQDIEVHQATYIHQTAKMLRKLGTIIRGLHIFNWNLFKNITLYRKKYTYIVDNNIDFIFRKETGNLFSDCGYLYDLCWYIPLLIQR